MSIENNLKRIADALEAIAAGGHASAATLMQGGPTNPVQPPTPTEAPKPAPVAVPPASMTPEELNAALVVQFNRLGGREGIDQEMAKIGASSVNQLTSEQYQPLLDAVQAIPA